MQIFKVENLAGQWHPQASTMKPGNGGVKHLSLTSCAVEQAVQAAPARLHTSVAARDSA